MEQKWPRAQHTNQGLPMRPLLGIQAPRVDLGRNGCYMM